jgi:hypothetical protein
VTFKELQKIVQSQSGPECNELMQRLKDKPFWIWYKENVVGTFAHQTGGFDMTPLLLFLYCAVGAGYGALLGSIIGDAVLIREGRAPSREVFRTEYMNGSKIELKA